MTVLEYWRDGLERARTALADAERGLVEAREGLAAARAAVDLAADRTRMARDQVDWYEELIRTSAEVPAVALDRVAPGSYQPDSRIGFERAQG